MTAILACPLSESCSSRVSFEFRYGMCLDERRIISHAASRVESGRCPRDLRCRLRLGKLFDHVSENKQTVQVE